MNERLSHLAALVALGGVALVATATGIRCPSPAAPSRAARRVRGYVDQGARDAR